MPKSAYPYFLRRPDVKLNAGNGLFTIKVDYRVRKSAKVRWFHNGTLLTVEDGFNISTSNKSSLLAIKEAMTNSAGLYTIEVFDVKMKTEVRTSIRVNAEKHGVGTSQDEPCFVKPSTIYLNGNDFLVLENFVNCKSTCKWDYKCKKADRHRFMPNTVISDNGTHQFQLKIKNPDYNDVGTYVGKVFTPAGIIAQKFIVRGSEKKRSIDILEVNMYTTEHFKNFPHATVMTLKYKCSPNSTYTATWISPDTNIIEDSELRKSVIVPEKDSTERIFTAKLITCDYSQSQSGTYLCRMRNVEKNQIEAVGEFTLNISKADEDFSDNDVNGNDLINNH